MKTVQDLYKEIVASDELKKAFLEAAKDGKLMDFIKAWGCEATEEEIAAFLKEKAGRELTDEELGNAAGGTCNLGTGIEAGFSVVTVGVGCATYMFASLATGHVGQEYESEGRLCTHD